MKDATHFIEVYSYIAWTFPENSPVYPIAVFDKYIGAATFKGSMFKTIAVWKIKVKNEKENASASD